MHKIINIISIFLPSFIQIPLRKLFGQKIGRGSKIGFGSFVNAKSIQIGNNVKIGNFTVIYAEKIDIGNNTTIKSFSFTKTRVIQFREYVHIANFAFINSGFMKNSKIIIGNHSRVFPFCWLDTGESIQIGKHVGIGGFTLIFTHSVWTNYLKGGPITYAPVVIEDEVWLPWRVFIMPGVTIGKKSIIGANSLVTKNVIENSLVAGSPAKIIRNNFIKEPSKEEKDKRLIKVIDDFIEFLIFKNIIDVNFEKTTSYYKINKNYYINLSNMKKGTKGMIFDEIKNNTHSSFSVIDIENLEINIYKNDIIANEFISFLRRYGIRLTIK